MHCFGVRCYCPQIESDKAFCRIGAWVDRSVLPLVGLSYTILHAYHEAFSFLFRKHTHTYHQRARNVGSGNWRDNFTQRDYSCVGHPFPYQKNTASHASSLQGMSYGCVRTDHLGSRRSVEKWSADNWRVNFTQRDYSCVGHHPVGGYI